MDLLRIATAGSVDDGKSTLIGRLLYDSKQVFEDTIASLERASEALGLGEVNLALLTDGLRAEREQGITIDVAYRYFATENRKFIIADSPGHVQYTRNMVTGASTAGLALLLVDARKGVIQQTRRHAAIATLLGIHELVLCVNKMDLVGWSQARFDEIATEFHALAETLGRARTTVIPMAALTGENVVEGGPSMPWYRGPALLDYLENVAVASPETAMPFRFPVQYVLRPQTEEFHDYRGYAGTVAAGTVRPGEDLVVLPQGTIVRVDAIDRYHESLECARAGDAIALRVAGDIDISRGHLFAAAAEPPPQAKRLTADLCWMSEGPPLRPRQQLWLKHTTRRVKCMVESLDDRLDIDTMEREQAPAEFQLNAIGRVTLRLLEPIFADPYAVSRETGSFILIDTATRNTVGAGMVREVLG